MKRIITIVIIGFVFSTVQAQMENPLKEGMPNTVKLASGEVIFDLNGEWDAVWDTGGYGTYQDVIKITQNEDKLVGIYLLKGDYHLKKGEEKVKGKLKGNAIDEVFLKDVDPATFELYWIPSQGSISKEGNEIVIKYLREYKGAKTVRTLSLKKK